MSMRVGLEVRVPFCDHRLVEYVYNAPWALKTYDGREKSLLRGAGRDLLPESVAARVKSPYPSTQDPQYSSDLLDQARELGSGDDVFGLVDHGWLRTVTGRDAAALDAVERQGLEWTLSLAAWLELYRPALAL
jgi:asparagine synthase (glutamine-hydrolysing)